MTFMVAHLTSSLYAVLQPIRERVYGMRATSDRALDVMAAVDMMIEMLDGPATRDRIALFDLALCNSQQLVRVRTNRTHTNAWGSGIGQVGVRG